MSGVQFPSNRVKEVNSLQDTEIIRLLWQRDESALSAVKEQYGTLCRQLAFQILGNSEDTEECLNDALFKLWNSVPPAEPKHLRAYYAAIVRHLALDRLDTQRAAKRGGEQLPLVLEELAEVTADAQDVEAEADFHRLHDVIGAFLQEQPKHQRIMFMQRYYYNMPVGDIAAEHGVSKNSAALTLLRLRKKLKGILRKEQYL